MHKGCVDLYVQQKVNEALDKYVKGEIKIEKPKGKNPLTLILFKNKIP